MSDEKCGWICGSLAIVLVLGAFTFGGVKCSVSDDRHRMHKESMVVDCVKAGGEPVACKVALGVREGRP